MFYQQFFSGTQMIGFSSPVVHLRQRRVCHMQLNAQNSRAMKFYDYGHCINSVRVHIQGVLQASLLQRTRNNLSFFLALIKTHSGR